MNITIIILLLILISIIYLYYKIDKMKDKKIYKNIFKYGPKKKYKRYIPKKPIIPEKPIKLPKPRDMNFVLPIMHISP